MPSYIIRKRNASKDGSSLGGLSQAHVTASSELEAKKQGADQLGVSIQHVEAILYPNPSWSELRG